MEKLESGMALKKRVSLGPKAVTLTPMDVPMPVFHGSFSLLRRLHTSLEIPVSVECSNRHNTVSSNH